MAFLAFLIVLGFLIFVHELGHFIAARKVGIRVDVFSLGFGPRLFGFKRGNTDYRISAIPFGGYVKMAGEDTEKTSGTPEELTSKSVPQRFLVFIAGAFMNLLVAVVFSILLAYIGFYVPAYTLQKPVIGWVLPDSPADKAGILAGDTILKIDRDPVATWDDALQALFINPTQLHDLMLNREDETLNVSFTPGELSETNRFGGLAFDSLIIIASTMEDSPARHAGLLPGDQILEVDGIPLRAVEQLQNYIHATMGRTIHLKVLRNSENVELDITPQFSQENQLFIVGVTFQSERILKKYPLAESIQMGFVTNYEMAGAMLNLVAQLVTGNASLKNLGGPIMIGVLASEAAKSGVRDLLSLVSFISLNLAILNLLPIPVLDGGLILFLLIEAIRRKPLSERIQIALQNIFFFLLISVALVVSYHDILRLFKGQF